MHFNIETKKIEIVDMERWKTISMLERIKFKMPSTTNALESSHGHLNAIVPRRNDFYTSLTRLINFVVEKTHNFRKACITNFNRAKRKIMSQTSPFYAPILVKELRQYSSPEKSCLCGEVDLLRNMMRVNIPCSHEVFKGAEFPDPPEINLKLSNSFSDFIVTYEEKTRSIQKKTKDFNDFLKKRTTETIRKFSSCKNCAIIEKTVDEYNIDNETRFVSKMPLSFYSAVANGIHNFHDFRQKQKNEKKAAAEVKPP